MASVYEILEEAGIEYRYFAYSGHCRGSKEGFPERVGQYSTVRYGYLDNYVTGSEFVGDWILVHEYYSSGAPEYPSTFKATYVKTKDYLKAKELLSKAGITPTDLSIPEVEERKKELLNLINPALESLSLEKLTKIYEIIEE